MDKKKHIASPKKYFWIFHHAHPDRPVYRELHILLFFCHAAAQKTHSYQFSMRVKGCKQDGLDVKNKQQYRSEELLCVAFTIFISSSM